MYVNWVLRCEVKFEYVIWLYIGLYLCGIVVLINVEGNVCNNSFEFWSICVL